MPPPGKGPRLWLRGAERTATGEIVRPARWIIRDGPRSEGTGCGVGDRAQAEQALANYIARKHVKQIAQRLRGATHIPVADVLSLYMQDVAPKHARPHETGRRITLLLGFFGTKQLSEITGSVCRQYADERGSDASARRELEELRAAINYYHAEGHVREIIKVPMPERRPARERWITRKEAAKLVLSSWRYRERQNGEATDRYTRRHVAKFCLVALYTGRRAGAVVQAALQPATDRGWIDLEHGQFLPRPGLRQTKKKQPSIQLPRRLLAHLRRWKAHGQKYVVEWNGEPIGRMAKAFRNAARAAGLSDVTPHTLRHTAATWGMQRRADPWALSGYLGMSLETLIRVYGHHHPDHQKEGWGVFDRPGGVPVPGTGIRERKVKLRTKKSRKTLKYQRGGA